MMRLGSICWGIKSPLVDLQQRFQRDAREPRLIHVIGGYNSRSTRRNSSTSSKNSGKEMISQPVFVNVTSGFSSSKCDISRQTCGLRSSYHAEYILPRSLPFTPKESATPRPYMCFQSLPDTDHRFREENPWTLRGSVTPRSFSDFAEVKLGRTETFETITATT